MAAGSGRRGPAGGGIGGVIASRGVRLSGARGGSCGSTALRLLLYVGGNVVSPIDTHVWLVLSAVVEVPSDWLIG